MVKVALNIPDCHIPYQDKESYDLMLTVAKDVDEQIGISEINILGDYLDFFNASLHPKGPASTSIKESLKDEIYEGIQKLKELRKLFPDATINFIEGNHEYRLARYIVTKCPDLYDLYSIQEMLTLSELSINFFPFGKSQLVRCLGTNLFMRHQPYNAGKNFASSTAHNKGISLIVGHTHRHQNYTIVRADGTEVTVYSSGWLGKRTEGPFDYVDTDDWSQGFSFTYSFGGVDDWFIHDVRIKNGKVIYNGNLYEA